MQTSIQHLPPEVLCWILQLGASSLPLTGDYSESHFLLSAALVSRTFRWPAQSVLLGSVRLTKGSTVTKWLATTHGDVEYPTRDLELHGIHGRRHGVTATMATRVLQKAFGVRRLELRDFGRLSVRALESKGLNRLSSLHILTTFPDKPATILALSLPFQLTSLFLYNSPYPPELIQKLFECSSRTLKTLSLSLLQSSPAYPALISNLHHIAPTLQSLSLNHRPSQPLIEALHLCTQLQHLTCNASVDLGAVLDSIQCPLLTLNIQLDYGLEQTLKILLGRMGRGSLASLKRMGVKVLIWGTESRLEDLRKECEKEKVDLYVETRTEGVEEALRLGLTTDLWHD